MAASMLGKKSEAAYSFEDGIMARMVDYVQAVIVSTTPVQSNAALTDEGWEELHAEVKRLYESLAVSYFLVDRARQKSSQPGYDGDYSRFCVEAQMHATFVRGFRYPSHDLEFLRDFLGPHDDELRKLFGISASDFVKGVEAIHKSLSQNGLAAFGELREAHRQAFDRLAEKKEAGPDGADLAVVMAELQSKPEWVERMNSIAGRIMGLHLFELERFTALPAKLLDELSLEPGQDQTFQAPGDYAGWPLRVFPTKWRPFLKVDGKHYCFDSVNIMDDMYRAMQRLICRLDPDYANTWNARQKDASERRPIELLQELLPGATVFRSLYYPWKNNESPKQGWCELDGLVLYDDMLLAVEVKGGAFTWTPPQTDFPAYLRSIEALLKKPAAQASRFLQYLRSAKTVALYDNNRNEVAKLTLGHFRVVVPLCVTLDALTTAAHQIRDLNAVGITVPEPVCVMAIDDLRVYRDILSNPLFFVHFLQKRYEAECDPLMHVNDELDHLGLYLAHLDYLRHARKLTGDLGGEIGGWVGYRKQLDQYYYDYACEPDKTMPPQPSVDSRIGEIISCLNAEALHGRCRCASLLLDMPWEPRGLFAAAFDRALSRSLERGRTLPFHGQGGRSITVFCEAAGIRSMSPGEKRDYTLAWMARANVEWRLLLTVICDTQRRVKSVSWEELRLADIQPEQRARISALSGLHARNLITRHIGEHGKIGRNEPCPCGSGRKFKRCCGKN